MRPAALLRQVECIGLDRERSCLGPRERGGSADKERRVGDVSAGTVGQLHAQDLSSWEPVDLSARVSERPWT